MLYSSLRLERHYSSFTMSLIKSIFLGVSVCLFIYLSPNFALPNSVRETEFYKMDQKYLIGNVTKILRAEDALACAFFCLSATAGDCYSFNFGGTAVNGLYTCELNNSERRLDLANIREVSDFAYYGLTAEVSLKSVYPVALCYYGLPAGCGVPYKVNN